MIQYYITTLTTIIAICALVVTQKRRIIMASSRKAMFGYLTLFVLVPFVGIPVISYVVF